MNAATTVNKLNVTSFQRLLLTAGSGLVSIFDPARDDMISAFGELTGEQALKHVHDEMLKDPEGSLILLEKPRISSQLINLSTLAALPSHTFGYHYVKFLQDNGISPDTRKPVLFVRDPELAYVMQRYREIHDFVHCILDMKTNMLGEVTVKVFEAIQLDLPMCWLAGIFGVLRLGPKHSELYTKIYLPWILQNAHVSKALINVYFEKHWNKPIVDLRAELGLTMLKVNKEVNKPE